MNRADLNADNLYFAHILSAKKLKADLIEKAKIKKKYFKEKAKAESENQSDSIFSERDEGRFAPEEGIGGQDGFDLVEAEKASQRRRRKEGQESSEGGNSMSKRKQAKAEAARAAELESRRRLLGGVMHADRDEKGQAVPEQRTFDKSKEMETSEQRKEERQKRQDKWNSKSGSRTGRQRGQPNLGARMDLLLDKIKKG